VINRPFHAINFADVGLFLAAQGPFAFALVAMKKQCSLEEIIAEMQRRIDTSNWANGYCAGCVAPTPYRIAHDGIANWSANVASSTKPGCESLLLEVVAAVRKECDLKPEPLKEAIRRLLSWR
jgi:hypothetical protein